MIGLIIKLLLTLGSLGYASYLFSSGYWGWGIVFTFLAALVALTIYRNENIILSLNQMRLGNQEKAKKYLRKIKQPQYLFKKQEAYYYYLKANVFGQELSLSQTESLFHKALEIGLKQKQDQAVAKMNIAAIMMQKGKRKEATILLNEAKKLDTGNVLTDQIKMLKNQMGRVGSSNQMRMAQMNKGRGNRVKTKMR